MADTLTVNLASRFDPKLVEAWDHKSITGKVTNQNYKFTGVKEVSVYSIPTTPLVDFSRTATSNRYGTPSNLDDTVQTMQVSQDKAFTKVIEAGDNAQQLNIKTASKFINLQNRKVIIPSRDTYNLQIMTAKPGRAVSASLSAENAYEKFLDGIIELMNQNVDMSEVSCIMSPNFYKYIHLDDNFILASDRAMKDREEGFRGTIEGVNCYFAGTNIIPTGFGFMLASKEATVTCEQLKELKTHTQPQGYSGQLIEARFIYDAWVLDELVHGIYVHWHSGTLVATPTATYTASSTDTLVLASATGSSTVYYTLDGSDPRRNADKLTYSTAIDTSGYAAGDVLKVKAYATAASAIDSNLLETDVTITA